MLQLTNNAFIQPLVIQPVFSLSFTIFMLSLHMMAFSILVMIAYVHTDITTQLLMFSLGIIVIYSGWRTFWRIYSPQNHLLYNSQLIILQEERDNQLVYQEYLLLHTGQRATVVNSSYAHPLLIILNAHLPPNRFVSTILWYDMLDKDTFRRLRVRIKYPFHTRTHLHFITQVQQSWRYFW